MTKPLKPHGPLTFKVQKGANALPTPLNLIFWLTIGALVLFGAGIINLIAGN